MVEKEEVYSLLGFKLEDGEVVKALERMRFGVEAKGNGFRVKIPAYRADIMHSWDVIEDVAIGFGYDRIEPVYPPTNTIGLTHPWFESRDLVREIMLGLGFLEVITFILTNEKLQYEYMNRKAKPWDDFVPLQHPLTAEHTILRTSILPSLLEVLSLNKHHPMPQKIFEVGDVVVGKQNRLKLSGVVTHPRANFSEIRSVVQALMKELGLSWEASDSSDGAFIAGRGADVIVGNRAVGSFGEINPEVLEKFDLTNPVAGFEIDLSLIFDTGELL